MEGTMGMPLRTKGSKLPNPNLTGDNVRAAKCDLVLLYKQSNILKSMSVQPQIWRQHLSSKMLHL